VRIFVIGAGQVGSTIVEALHDEHDLTVIDLDRDRLEALEQRWEVVTRHGDGASRRELRDAGIESAALCITCTSRDEVNIISAIFSKSLSPEAKTVVRTGNVEYLELWRERHLDFDHMVSSEEETAHAVLRTIGLPAAKQTDVFADGRVQIIELDVEPGKGREGVIGLPLREARIPAESRVAGIIRRGEQILPRGEESIFPGDRIIVIGSPAAMREWSAIVAGDERPVDDVVIFGGGRTGVATARILLEQGIRTRVVEADRERARIVDEKLPGARVFHATGIDEQFLTEERIGRVEAAVFAMRDDAKNLYAATLAKLHGVDLTIGVAHEAISMEIFEHAGVDVALNPRLLTAEEMVRFAHDPRTQQVAMLEGDRYEILDITIRASSRLLRTPFKDLPMTGTLIGAIVRDGEVIFPHGADVLEAGDRVILFTASSRVREVERAL
jgi:trk system potassium uptake protein